MIGVVIPVHDEAPVLARCLAGVRRAACDPRLGGEPVQVFVTLDACADDSERIAAAFGAQIGSCHERDVGAARTSAAMRAIDAGARWLASTDADSEVPPDWLSAQLAWRAEAVCGIVHVRDWAARDPRLRAAYDQHYQARDDHRHVHGANLGVSARAYRHAGGFMAGAGGEDVSLVRRLQARQVRIAWVARPCVVTSARHSHRCPNGFAATLDRLEARLWEAACGRPAAGRPWKLQAVANKCASTL